MLKIYDEYYPDEPSERVLPTGSYVLKIINMWDVPSKEYVLCVWDIAEGDYTDFYSNLDSDNRFEHYNHCHFLSYKSEFTLRYVRQFFDALNRSNPGFNAAQAWDDIVDAGNKDFSAFIGKLVGARLVEDTYQKYNSENKRKVDTFTTVSNVHTGRIDGGQNA